MVKVFFGILMVLDMKVRNCITSHIQWFIYLIIYTKVLRRNILGEWKDDTKCGFGIYEYKNKDIYEGGWKKNKRHGLGTYKYVESNVKFIGTWIEDKIHGPGQIVYPQYSFYGSWEFNTVIFL